MEIKWVLFREFIFYFVSRFFFLTWFFALHVFPPDIYVCVSIICIYIYIYMSKNSEDQFFDARLGDGKTPVCEKVPQSLLRGSKKLLTPLRVGIRFSSPRG